MTARIHHIETLVPQYAYSQEQICSQLERWCGDRHMARTVRVLSRHSGISKRHSVLPDLVDGAEPVLFRTNADGRVEEASTEERNRVYTRECGALAVEVARRAVDACTGFTARDITHVVTVSCTGFYAPGADFEVVNALGLPGSTERYHIGFMGCYGAFPALKMAKQFCEANPDAVVLIVDIELCTLHMQIRPTADSMLGNTLFADGAAAAIVSAREPAGDQPVIALGRFVSAVAPNSATEMAWEIGNSGFNMVLSTYVPDIIGANIGGIVDDLLAEGGCTTDDIDLWAVHPGGRAIVDKVEAALGLAPGQLAASRQILSEFGNMSSVTILFVLQRLLRDPGATAGRVCAMGFGPGLVVETALAVVEPAAAVTAKHEACAVTA